MDTFYQDLKAFSQFESVVLEETYHPLPHDWLLVITDISGSTKAIQAGRYKDVNVLGAASIVAALNSTNGIEIPFVFGGDGATLAIPPQIEGAVTSALRQARWIAQKRFQMDLRIGCFKVSDLRSRGADVKVAKYQLAPQVRLAMFRGEGLRIAEEGLKDPTQAETLAARYSAIEASEAIFNGLECRWHPLEPQRGKVASLIVATRVPPAQAPAVYSELLRRFDEIMDHQPLNPVNLSGLSISVSPWLVQAEAKVRSGTRGLWGRIRYTLNAVKIMFFGWVLIKLGKTGGSFNPKKYLNELITNSDYRKFDNSLRMVLDCSEEQARRLRAELDGLRDKGVLFYGLHLADLALMTCVVFSFENHMHFIDGADGGYAQAAVELKKQMAASRK